MVEGATRAERSTWGDPSTFGPKHVRGRKGDRAKGRGGGREGEGSDTEKEEEKERELRRRGGGEIRREGDRERWS